MVSPQVKLIAGNLKHCYPAWKKTTSDPVILNIINEDLQINFKNHIPYKGPFEHKHSQMDSDIISKVIKKKKITKTSNHKMCIDEADYFSSLLVRPKKDGSFQTILNLKYLNEECFTYYYKMKTIKQIIRMVTPNCCFASLDINNVFYTVLIYKQHKKYLKFPNKGIGYQFEVMPKGYLDAMRVFTQILKPPFPCLREQG